MDVRVGIVAAIWFFQVSNYFDRVAMSFAGPSIMKSLSMEPSTFGIVLSSFGVGYFLAQIPGGLLADRWGAKPVLVIAPLFWALFTGMTGLVSGVAGFIVVRACFGISEGISNAACYKVIGDHFSSQERARAVSVWATAFAVAPAFAGPLVGTLLAAFGWQAVFMFMVVPALIAALLNYLLIPASRLEHGTVQGASVPARTGGGTSFHEVVGRPSLWLMSLAYLAFNIAYWGYLGWMPSYLALAHHVDVKSIGILGGIPYVFALLGLLLAGWLGSTVLYRFRPQLLVCFYLLAGLSLYFAYRSDTLTLSLVGLSSAAFFLYGGLGPLGAIVLDLAPERSRAAYSAVVNTAGQVGGAIAPVVIGFLVSATGTFASGFALMIAGLCVAAICLLAVVPLLSIKKPFRALAATPPVADA